MPAVSNGIRYTPVPFLVIVSGGSVLSQVKSDQEPVEEEPVSYQVKKVWKGDDADDRPGSVAIRLLRDGQLVETVTLNANNHWTYTWEDTPGHTWQAEEAQVPNGYQASVSQSGNTFTVTNTWKNAGRAARHRRYHLRSGRLGPAADLRRRLRGHPQKEQSIKRNISI